MIALLALSVLALGVWGLAVYLYVKRRETTFETWSRVFEPPDRDAWQDPSAVLALCALRPTSTVADVGAATGYFTRWLAEQAPNGRVFALEKEPIIARELAQSLASRANVTVLCTDVLALPEPVDCVLIVNTWRFVADRLAYARALYALASRVVIVDFSPGDWPVGPKDAKKLARTEVVAELTQAGFELSGEATLRYQYALVFNRP